MPAIVGVTGHRPPKLGGYSVEAMQRLTLFAAQWLRDSRPGIVITGMAQGWDTAVAQACADVGVPFIAAVPFSSQDARWPPEARLRYGNLLGLASKVHIVSPGPYEPAKMQIRNEWMADHATEMAALWD